MKHLLTAIIVFIGFTLSGQIRPDFFTLEENPDTSNFEVYSQKNGTVSRTTLDRLGKYVLDNLAATYSSPNLILSYFGVSDTTEISSTVTSSFSNDTLYINSGEYYLGDYDNTLSYDTATLQLTLTRKGTNSTVSLATLSPSVSYNTGTYQLAVGDATADLTTLRQTLTYNSGTRELTLSNSGGTVTLTGAGSDGNGIYSGGGTLPTGSITASGTRNVSNVAQTSLLFKNYLQVTLEAQLNGANAEKASLTLSNLTTGSPAVDLSTVKTQLQLQDNSANYAYVNLENESTQQKLSFFETATIDYTFLGDYDNNLFISLYQQSNADDDYIELNNNDAGYRVRLDSNVMRYMADYSANFVDRTLVDKGYVDTQIAANVGGGGVFYDQLTNGDLQVKIVSSGSQAGSYILTANATGNYTLTVPSGAEILKISILGRSSTLQPSGAFQFTINNNNNTLVYYPQVGVIDLADGAILDLYTAPDFAPDIDIADRQTTITMINMNALANQFVVTIR